MNEAHNTPEAVSGKAASAPLQPLKELTIGTTTLTLAHAYDKLAQRHEEWVKTDSLSLDDVAAWLAQQHKHEFPPQLRPSDKRRLFAHVATTRSTRTIHLHSSLSLPMDPQALDVVISVNIWTQQNGKKEVALWADIGFRAEKTKDGSHFWFGGTLNKSQGKWTLTASTELQSGIPLTSLTNALGLT
ncbi:hypothetical protein H8N00_12595 [Streptomyces sp. AC563]|uniref:hypothetical protein n=1 Tax=Streptomyces buecherae TaxID=2763006 RepID=UPI00164E9F33|nr:hypothetical protein [Streptomyces buecherae]MBC3989698.1 hypothetical protein [Streptomyces buecherae]